MKVIIIGAGGVGYVAAATISGMHDVLVIENEAEVADVVKNRLNVSVLHEDGTNPDKLRTAISVHQPDVLISTLGRDDSNLFICMLAKKFKPDMVTVASVTDPDYALDEELGKQSGVDIIISPELITAEKMYRLCTLENALDYDTLPVFNASMAIMEIHSASDLIGKIVMKSISLDDATIFAVYRSGTLHFQIDTMEIHPGDKLCIMGTDAAISKLNADIGVQVTARDIVILGGSIVGIHLARLLSDDDKKRYVRLIDKDYDHCRELSKILNGIVVVNGDFTDPELQSSENIFKSDCLVSVADQDDTNLLMCMTAQKYNSPKIVSRYLKKEYMDIFMFTGLETIVGMDRTVSNEISKCVMSSDKVLLRMRNPDEQFFLHVVTKQAKLMDRYYGDLVLPNGVRILAINRNGSIIYPKMDTKFEDSDHVMVFTNFTRDKDLAKVFGRNAIFEV